MSIRDEKEYFYTWHIMEVNYGNFMYLDEVFYKPHLFLVNIKSSDEHDIFNHGFTRREL